MSINWRWILSIFCWTFLQWENPNKMHETTLCSRVNAQLFFSAWLKYNETFYSFSSVVKSDRSWLTFESLFSFSVLRTDNFWLACFKEIMASVLYSYDSVCLSVYTIAQKPHDHCKLHMYIQCSRLWTVWRWQEQTDGARNRRIPSCQKMNELSLYDENHGRPKQGGIKGQATFLSARFTALTTEDRHDYLQTK